MLLFFIVKTPTPAIVTQAGARRFPRWALWLLCCAYVLFGYIGRDGWKSADMAALGVMAELAHGTAQWFAPTLMGIPEEHGALLPYWLGALFMQWAPPWMAVDFAPRIPFGLLLALTLMATWYSTYYLARSPQAQPVAFAFGGEAKPTDYARAIADGGLLALIACLGLAHLSHETTPALAQLGFAALLFYAAAALPYHPGLPSVVGVIALIGLSLSGAPSVAFLLGMGTAAVHFLDRTSDCATSTRCQRRIAWESMAIVLVSLLALAMAQALGLLRWQLHTLPTIWSHWAGSLELWVWFTWPAWPLAGWTLWSWRGQLFSRKISRHIALPLWYVGISVVASATTDAADRSLLLALPALAALAAFALPTLKRQMAALIDWFTLFFFSGCAFTIWVIWIAMQTGFPPQPAANVTRLAPGFEPHFSAIAFGFACAATMAWIWLVQWRIGRHPAAIWKSLVLPAGGASLGFVLLMTLWMPLLNYAQSYKPMVLRTQEHLSTPSCIEVFKLGHGQIAAFQFYGKLPLQALSSPPACPWLLAEPGPHLAMPSELDASGWDVEARIEHPANVGESVLLLRRK